MRRYAGKEGKRARPVVPTFVDHSDGHSLFPHLYIYTSIFVYTYTERKKGQVATSSGKYTKIMHELMSRQIMTTFSVVKAPLPFPFLIEREREKERTEGEG